MLVFMLYLGVLPQLCAPGDTYAPPETFVYRSMEEEGWIITKVPSSYASLQRNIMVEACFSSCLALLPTCISPHPLGMFCGHIPRATGSTCGWKGIPIHLMFCECWAFYEPILGIMWETEKM